MLKPSYKRLFLLALAVLTASCDQAPKPLMPVSQTGELVVITRAGPTTYYKDSTGVESGLEFELASRFAKHLNVKLRIVVADRFSEIIPALMKHQAHMAAAGLSVTDGRKHVIVYGPPYQTVQEQAAYNVDTSDPIRTAKDLLGKRIEVVAGSSYVERLLELKKKYPMLQWIEKPSTETEDLLARLDSGETDVVIADSHIINITRNFFPNLAAGFALAGEEQLAWAFPKDVEPQLLRAAQQFFKQIKQDGTLKKLLDRYYGHISRLTRADREMFLQRIHTILPKYRRLFEEAQENTDVDWRLLAAIGYQESHWDPFATSPTGVRGLMMLTEDTADRMGVSNRLDPRQSILAGARYFVLMRDSLPDDIEEPDRSWLALAAYNVGIGHLADARVLADKQKLDPDSWADVKRTLPLLSRPQYASQLKYGFARGGEPVIFAENIRSYYDILQRFEKPYVPLFAPLGDKSKYRLGQQEQPKLKAAS